MNIPKYRNRGGGYTGHDELLPRDFDENMTPEERAEAYGTHVEDERQADQDAADEGRI